MLNYKKKKILLALIASLVLSGCMSNNFYILSVSPQPIKTYPYTNTKEIIAVEKIIVPEYLFKRDIAIAKSSSQISFLSNATWAEDLDTGLTLRLISFLQKKFNQPNVYQYPWGLDTQPNKKIKVHISRFIAQGNIVYLNATWEVENMSNHMRISRLFNTQISTTNLDASNIVSAMNKAFNELEEIIALGILNVLR